MAENIGGANPMSSGGHVWRWRGPRVVRKTIVSAGLRGEYDSVVAVGARPGVITGRGHHPAVLKAADDAAMTALEAAMQGMVESGYEYAWEDDAGRTGTALQVTAYQPIGGRHYVTDGVWQYYRLAIKENDGG